MTAIHHPREASGDGFLTRYRRTALALHVLLIVVFGVLLGGAIGLGLTRVVELALSAVHGS